METKRMLKEYLVGLGEIYQREITEALLGIYWTTLEGYTDEECKVAFDKAIKTLKFFPKPAELIELMTEDSESIAMYAWMDFRRSIGQVGCSRSIRFEDPVIHSVIKFLGGWDKIGQTPDADMKWLQKDFIKAYGRMCSSTMDHPEYLIGSTEINNSARGFAGHIKEPTFFPCSKSTGVRQITDESNVVEGIS